MIAMGTYEKHAETEIVYLLLGSNQGDRAGQIQEAINRITGMTGQPVALSSIYETEPWGFKHKIPFLNQTMALLTGVSPGKLMQLFMSVERGMGRIRNQIGYQARSIDIDILFCGMDIINQNNLVIPHPLFCERRFALVPMEEIAPDFVHPLLNKSIRELLHECSDPSWVKKWSGPAGKKG
ncbi:MAG: 2-amino-4-hydroxy-6-hydroxymethyldihydropteridine diphosphokinase [Bacteroidales bacterium]|nr:2-amino-4-hydroxy-6-hydroxymethyldihydropteridine diphosphokinase [Bacteroidales bacterium]